MPFPTPHLLPRRNHGCRIETETALWGHRAVVLQNERLRLTVLAGKGADIVEFLYKPLDVDFLWANPSGPRPTETILPPSDNQNCFGDFYHGGWQELFPHGSVGAEVYGAKMVQHGEVWGRPWEVSVDEDRPERVAVTFRVRTRRTPFVLERRMSLTAGQPAVTLDETVYNLCGQKLGVLWGHHPAFGAPFLSRDCVLYAPAKTILVGEKQRTSFPVGQYRGKRRDFSRMPAPGSGAGGMLYFDELSEGWYAVVNHKRKIGFGMRWDARRFPAVWIWREAGSLKKSPWFGEAYAMAVEPFSHLPQARERGEKLLPVPAHGKLRTRFLALAIPGGGPVKGISKDGRVR